MSVQKEVVYIDVEDDITAIIDKMQLSKSKIVALVLPKRAAVLQSIVNMKLLRRMADTAKKNIVLISSDPALFPLAGIVGMYVAKTPQSKPFMPEPPMVLGGAADQEKDIELDQSAPIGALAAQSLESEAAIEIDNDQDEALQDSKGATPENGNGKPKKSQKVPNFERFRVKLFIGMAILILLAVAWYVMTQVMPKARVIITTDNTRVNVNLSLVAAPAAQEVSIEEGIIPAKVQEFRKSDTQKVPATGQKDIGTKATGTVTLALDDCEQPSVTIPAGTTVSGSNLNFITQTDITLMSVKFGNQCRNDDFTEVSTGSVKVTAQNAGDQYNLAARSYTVAGRSNVSATGSAMSGGTSNIVKVVTQADIDGARDKIIESSGNAAADILAQQLVDEGYVAIVDSLKAGDSLVTASPNADTQAEEVTVTVVVPYSMTGFQQSGLTQAVEASIKSQIDETKQNILDNGMADIVIRMTENSQTNGNVSASIQTVALAGVAQDEQRIKESVVGKSRGEIQELLTAFPGIRAVEVEYSPFWVMSTTRDPQKITIVFQQEGDGTGPE